MGSADRRHIRHFKPGFAIARRVFMACSVLAITFYLSWHWPQVKTVFQRADLVAISLPIAAMSLVHLFVALGFHETQKALGLERRCILAISSYFWRLPARYLPGGIWQTLGRFHDIHAHLDVSKAFYVRLFVLEVVLVGATGLGTAGAALLMYGSSANHVQVGVVASSLAIAITGMAAIARSWFQVSAIGRYIASAALYFVLHWIVIGTSFAAYAAALTPTAPAACGTGALLASYDLAASLGYVAIFAPQGWGVTEFAFSWLGECGFPVAVGVAMVAGFRVLGLVSDALAFAGWALLSATLRIQARNAR